jgi:hypothetical protein
MRRLLPILIAISLPVSALAQSPAKPSAPAATAKKSVKKPAKKVVEPAEPAEIDEERMAVAPRVLQGESVCEFGHKVAVHPHPHLPGRFHLLHRGQQHVLTPQPTTTGVVRLENAKAGLLWLQVPVKSMLMDTKKGQRVADQCMHPAQHAEVEAMRANGTATQ